MKERFYLEYKLPIDREIINQQGNQTFENKEELIDFLTYLVHYLDYRSTWKNTLGFWINIRSKYEND